MIKENCNKFDTCSAPLCPRDLDSLNELWFPTEEICTQVHSKWIRNQRKIQNKTKCFDTCYTLKMLNRNITIKTGITGIDPDRDPGTEEQKWILKRPERKDMPEDRKAELRERMQSLKVRKSA